MRFTSLTVELVRARPRLIFWIAVLLQAGLWFVLPMLLYAGPPGDLATTLAFGREYQLGTQLGPPLAFWLADIAFRLAGGHIFGVYLLAELCFIVTLWAVFALGRAIVGGPHAALAILLTATITAFSFPNLEFGPAVLACPLWALSLLHAWRVMGQGRRGAWFALSIAVGLLFLTTQAAIVLVVLLACFALATKRGRQALCTLDPLLAVLIAAILALPYLVWLMQATSLPSWPTLDHPLGQLKRWGNMLGMLTLALSGVVVLALANWRGFSRKPEDAPTIYRPALDRFARGFVYVFAFAPPLVLSLIAVLAGRDEVAGGEGVALLLIGLAVIVAAGDVIHLRREQTLRTIWLLAILAPALFVLGATVLRPWSGGREVKTLLPASAMGHFFGDTYRLRANHPLQMVAGDPELATLIGVGAPSHPRVLFDATPGAAPWLTLEQFNAMGGLVVWRATDTVGAPPAELVSRFPGLVPEIPRVFTRMVTGRQSALRVGWGIIRPKAAAQGTP